MASARWDAELLRSTSGGQNRWMQLGSIAEWASAVGTILAFFAAIRAVRMQSKELALQREELTLQRKELARNVATQEELAQVELERLLGRDDSTVAVSLSGSFFKAEVTGDALVMSIENRSNWRMSDLRLVLFGQTDVPSEFVYKWPSDQILAAYDAPVPFVDAESGQGAVLCNASVSMRTDVSIGPLGTTSATLPVWDQRLSVAGFLVTFVSAGRRWVATDTGGRWGEQLELSPLPVDGPFRTARFCRENDVRLFQLAWA